MISNHPPYKTIFFILCFFLTLSSCSDNSEGENPVLPGQISWKTASSVTADAGSATLSISGTIGAKWTAEITAGANWCSFVSNDFTGSGQTVHGEVKDGLNILYLYYAANTDSEERTAAISFTFDGETEPHTLSLKQVAAGQSVLPDFEGGYAETPAHKQDANYIYVTHYVKLDNRNVRNYSLCFDKTKKAALWVAYPLHKAYTSGDAGRVEDWNFDPSFESSFQPELFRSYKNSNNNSYDRGHQIPSADRQATDEMNRQTFYFSNMTPQLGQLNQKMWGKLEAKVRTYNCEDTLYVVTGAYFANTSTTTYDGAGNLVPVPTNYFKVLLRTKSGKTGKYVSDCTASELKAIGFWVDQKSYGNVEPPRSICTSVADIEQKTGFTFFPTIPDAVKQDYNPTDWNIN
ncbi:DNA/RNA non-specific endonuclease [Bacteroides clarus]|uniref:DNA/RNA non-specific endonuclease n=1 Tax=Bacteroides clarus TaxID=626929 RepID=UPI00248F0C59|nr:DNA/RNA non-specific endonuclease [Bacteroides clarus]